MSERGRVDLPPALGEPLPLPASATAWRRAVADEPARRHLGEIAKQITAAVGVELRRRRMERGLPRRTVCARLRESTGHDISTNTLATYELGTRQPPLERIVALCLTQDIRLSEILATVESELLDGSDNALTVNLRTIAKTTSIVLSPVRGWARIQLDAGRTTAELTTDSIANLATASGLDATEIRGALLAHAHGRQNGGSR